MGLSFKNFKLLDIHYHSNPDLYIRRYDPIQIGKMYKNIDGGVVLKSHIGSTAIQATIAQSLGLPVFPSLVLNKVVGGINYRPIIRELAAYQPILPSNMIVHLPTITGRKHSSKLLRNFKNSLLKEFLCEPETIFNDEGKLNSNLIDILKMTRDYPMVLSTGHSSKEETYSLIEACNKYNVPALILNQPANPLTGLSAFDLMEIIKENPFIWTEQTALTVLLKYQSKHDFSKVLSELPRVIYSSDLGQTSQIDLNDWITLSNQWFLEFNISDQRKKEICLDNPLKLIQQ